MICSMENNFGKCSISERTSKSLETKWRSIEFCLWPGTLGVFKIAWENKVAVKFCQIRSNLWILKLSLLPSQIIILVHGKNQPKSNLRDNSIHFRAKNHDIVTLLSYSDTAIRCYDDLQRQGYCAWPTMGPTPMAPTSLCLAYGGHTYQV